MLKNCTLFLLLLLSVSLQAQTYRLYGKVSNSKGEPLSYVSVQVKELRTGTVTKTDGSYELLLQEGAYTLQVSMIGFKDQTLSVTLRTDLEQNITLHDNESQNLSEVVIKAKTRDRAEEVMRQLIRNKEKLQAASGPYSVRLYIKAVQQDSAAATQKQRKRRQQGYTPQPADSSLKGMAMTEVVLKLDYESDSKLKEERLGVKKSGAPKNLYYLSATEGNFNLYNNLLKIPTLSPTPFVSPVSYSGLVAYKFKTIRVQRTGKHRIYTLAVKPRQLTNATLEGELTVSDSAWAVLHARFRFPEYHLQEYGFFEVEQHYGFVQDTAWMLTRQQFTYHTKGTKKKLSGQTVVTYTNYELHKQFNKKHFSHELSATAREAYERDSAFWAAERTAPLSQKEVRLVRFQDSVYALMHSDKYLDSLERQINRITWQKVGLFGQSFYTRKKERYWHLPPLVSLFQPFAFGGSRLNVSLAYSRVFESRKSLSFHSSLSYGFRNSDINGMVNLRRLYNPFNRGFYEFSAGREFQFIYEGDAWINLIKRNNIYLNNYVGAGHGLELFNGFFVHAEAEMAFRRSVANYRTGKLVDSVLGDYLDNNQPVPFEPYNALYGKIKLQYTPFQKYRREPREKVIIGSKWPTVYTLLRKGVPHMLGSKVDFDYLEFGLEQQLNLGLIGFSKYSVRTGSFINRRNLRLIDYQFQRRGDPLLFMNPHRAFQALDSTFPVFNRFYEGHYVHEFNGLFLNKIPLFKKLQLREMGGAGFLIAPERNLRYAELFVGVERAFQSPFNPLDRFKLGIYVVGSAANQFHNPIQLKVGFTTWDKRRNRWF